MVNLKPTHPVAYHFMTIVSLLIVRPPIYYISVSLYLLLGRLRVRVGAGGAGTSPVPGSKPGDKCFPTKVCK